MDQQASVRGRRAFWFTTAAFAWGACLLGAALVVPAYGSSTASAPSGASVAGAPLTLVQVNGAGVLIPLAVPAVIAALVWVALHRKCSRGGRTSGFAAWALIWVLVAGCIVGLASVGLFAAPVAALLGVAASLTPSAPGSAAPAEIAT